MSKDKIERLFLDFSEEIEEIYENCSINEAFAKKVKEAVIKCFAERIDVQPNDFLNVVMWACNNTTVTTKEGVERALTKEEVEENVELACGRYIDGDPEIDMAVEFSDGNHDYGTGTNINF